MRPTPTLPTALRTFSHAAYTNIYELCPQESRIFGTESLYGDWDAETLLLAKDFAPACLIHQRLADGCVRPYHHSDWIETPQAPGAQTNKKLYVLAEDLPGRKLYGSAFGGLLRNDCNVSGALPDFRTVRRMYAEPLIHFTIRQMPNLRAIACLGNTAWSVLSAAADDRSLSRNAQRTCRDRRAPIISPFEGRRIAIFPLQHPAARGVKLEEHRVSWQPLADYLSQDLPNLKGAPQACLHCRQVATKRAA